MRLKESVSDKQWKDISKAYDLIKDAWASVSKAYKFSEKNLKFLKGQPAYNEKEDMYETVESGLYECFSTLEHLEYVTSRFAEDNGSVL